jgi:hypothetical protein
VVRSATGVIHKKVSIVGISSYTQKAKEKTVKKFIFCLITVSVIATLLLSVGPAFAKSEWTQYPIGNNISDFEANWNVEPYDHSCYSYDVVDGTLIVTANPNCVNERFFARVKDGGQAKEVRADVKKISSSGCWRVRLVADPLFVPDVVGLPHPYGERDGTVIHQLSLVDNGCVPSTMARLLAYPDGAPFLLLFEGRFMTPWSGQTRPDYPPLVGHNYTLKLSVREQHIDSEISDYGEITFDVPGLQQLPGEDFIGLSCYSPNDGDSGEAHFSNVWVRY